MNEENRRFQELKKRLPRIYSALQSNPEFEHTSVIVPSLSVDQEELSKVLGAAYYEERLLFALIRLRNPNARVIYVTSQPIHPDIIDYYLELLEGVPLRSARERLRVLSVWDTSQRALTEKILERPRFLARIRDLIDAPEHAYLTCYNSTVLERRLALALDIPLNGMDPELLDHGTKSGNRRIFAEAGVNFPAGREGLRDQQDVVTALLDLGQQRPEIKRAVVKLNNGFGGEGNGVFHYPSDRGNPARIAAALATLLWTSSAETSDSFMSKLAAMGGVVEELIEAAELRSPSVQMRISPLGQPEVVSSHEQVLGGATGQSYLGCQFPARDEYRTRLMSEALNIGHVLSRKGVIGRFAVDFVVGQRADGQWQAHAIEINLRMGGTTPPFYALEFLSGGQLDAVSGRFIATDGTAKYYSATDNLKSPAYRGLLPEDLLEITTRHGIGYRHTAGTGTLFYMIGALSQYGKLGMTCIADSPEAAAQLFADTTGILDREASGLGSGAQAPLLDRNLAME